MSRIVGYHHSEKTKKKITSSVRKFFNRHKNYRIGKNNPFYGKIHSDESKQKIRESNYHSNLKKENNPNFNNHQLKVEKNPNWIDGRSYKKYPPRFIYLRPIIRKRDNYICQNCSMTQIEHIIIYRKRLDVHHIDYNRNNNKENNLITLCKRCNLGANKNREYWKKVFRNKRSLLSKNI